jgi:hypothetical protein
MQTDILPKWSKEITRFLTVKPQFILWGNIYDVYPFELDSGITTFKLTDYLKTLLVSQGYNMILNYQPLEGFHLMEGNPEVFKSITGEGFKSPQEPLLFTLNGATRIIEKISANNAVYSAVILSFSSRLPELTGNDIHEFYYNLFKMGNLATPKMIGEAKFPRFNLVFLLLDKENDLPAWYTIDNSRVKTLAIPKPDYFSRKIVVENVAKALTGFSETSEDQRKEISSLFIDQTSNLHASEILSIVTVARRENIPFAGIGEAIKRYKLGIIENPWSKLDLSKIRLSEDILSLRVKGQKNAITKAADILKRAAFNLSGSQYSKYSQRPKGVLFFAGPTGVGKTELAKSVTELIFGSETSYIRFDMSEFSAEHSDQRLVGAPPGYVGYDLGGELTNSIKQNPFSVVLFDEIEKANPKILDIFLQILDDGRLTSGRGETVYFSEALIIFTSNLGIYEIGPQGERIRKVMPEMEYRQIEDTVKNSIEDFFKFRIGRPEILNRIGENIVVFDFIRTEIAHSIFDRMLGKVLDKIIDSYRITITLAPEAEAKLKEICCQNLDMGGRGIGNKVEDAFINPVSRALFSQDVKEGDKLQVDDISKEGSGWNLAITKQFLSI